MPENRKIMVPIAVVIHIPVEACFDDCDGLELVPTRKGKAVCVTDVTKCVEAFASIAAAARESESIARAMDTMLIAARSVETDVPGSEIEATPWFGGTPFMEV
jgi:hypothetical protein